jgi:hypothetical protein
MRIPANFAARCRSHRPVLLSHVDAPVPIRHENLTSAQDCPGFWTRSLDK